MIYHLAKLTYRAVARRFYHYGVYAAQYTLSRKSWRLGLHHGAGSVKQAYARGRERYILQRARDAGDKVLSKRAKFYRAFVIAALTFEFEMGWRRAMRRAGVTRREEVAMPPVLADRYVDFSEIEVTRLRAY